MLRLEHYRQIKKGERAELEPGQQTEACRPNLACYMFLCVQKAEMFLTYLIIESIKMIFCYL